MKRRFSKIRPCVLGTAVLLAAVLSAGCEGPIGTVEGKGSPPALPPGEDSAAYLDRLSEQSTVSENDAMRGLLLLLDGKDEATSFEQRREMLAQRGIVSGDWTFQKDRPVTRGKFAYMVYRAIGLPGGVILTLTGPSQRYCLREMVYHRFMAEGALLAPVTGMECVEVLTRAEAYRRTGQPPAETPLDLE